MNNGLGAILHDLMEEHGVGLPELTVMSYQKDPFRLDIPSCHRKGRWLRDQMQRLGLLDRAAPIHLRGLHYALVAAGDVLLPESEENRKGRKSTRGGQPYTNDDYCWEFLMDEASKAARWLGYIPFEKIIDARNSEPIIREIERPDPRAVVHIEANHSFTPR